MTEASPATGWIVWATVDGGDKPEPVGAGMSPADAVDHARSRGYEGCVVRPDSAVSADRVRRVLDGGEITDAECQAALAEIQEAADAGDCDAAEWLRRFATHGGVH